MKFSNTEVRTVLRWTAALLAGVILLTGCGKGETASGPATAPTTAPTTASQPNPAVLTIGGEDQTFAVTQLQVIPENGQLTLLLSGADRAKNPANTFSFRFIASVDDPVDLPGQSCQFDSAGSDADGTIGIHQANDTLDFLPGDVTIDLSGTYPNLTVNLRGQLLRDGDEDKPVSVKGTFTVVATTTDK